MSAHGGAVERKPSDELGRALHRLVRTVDDLLLGDAAPKRDDLRTLRLLGSHALHALGAMVAEDGRRRWATSFEAGLRSVVAACAQATGAAPHVQVHGSPDRLSVELADVLRQVVTEAMGNVCHDTRASVLLVSLAVDDDGVVLDIVDDGVDLECRQVVAWDSSVDLGLRRMGRIVRAAGGRLTVHRLRPRGLRLHVSVPIAARQAR